MKLHNSNVQHRIKTSKEQPLNSDKKFLGRKSGGMPTSTSVSIITSLRIILIWWPFPSDETETPKNSGRSHAFYCFLCQENSFNTLVFTKRTISSTLALKYCYRWGDLSLEGRCLCLFALTCTETERNICRSLNMCHIWTVTWLSDSKVGVVGRGRKGGFYGSLAYYAFPSRSHNGDSPRGLPWVNAAQVC